MAIVLTWFRVFKLSWWRRCKTCGVRGSKCLCSRPSLAMEHIFFLEDRKNRLGVRNFSHVSDSAMAPVPTATTTVATGPSFGENYRAGDFYRAKQQEHERATTPTDSSSSSSTAIVRRQAGAVVPLNQSSLQYQHYDDMAFNYSHNGYGGEMTPYYGPDRYDSSRAASSRRRALPSSRNTNGSSGSRRQAADDQSLSIQVYRGRQGRVGRSSSRSSSHHSGTDSVIVRPSNSGSSVRASLASDRMSVDNNIGSFNPRGRYFDGNYAPSIQEDEEDAMQRLQGLLHNPSPASSTSTILEHTRYQGYAY
ncbi:hypothetical protein PINS_up019165 [Pythium insidiosum]|nr:hypothetical protein PINS_up011902 [Pythium insidiosum]GLE08159.1 hypothetical protein PINS_up019165 [Pythium insidiosum]